MGLVQYGRLYIIYMYIHTHTHTHTNAIAQNYKNQSKLTICISSLKLKCNHSFRLDYMILSMGYSIHSKFNVMQSKFINHAQNCFKINDIFLIDYMMIVVNFETKGKTLFTKNEDYHVNG